MAFQVYNRDYNQNVAFSVPLSSSTNCMVAAIISKPILPISRVRLLFTKLIVVPPDISSFRTVRCPGCACVLGRHHESVRQYGSYQYQKYVLNRISDFLQPNCQCKIRENG